MTEPTEGVAEPTQTLPLPPRAQRQGQAAQEAPAAEPATAVHDVPGAGAVAAAGPAPDPGVPAPPASPTSDAARAEGFFASLLKPRKRRVPAPPPLPGERRASVAPPPRGERRASAAPPLRRSNQPIFAAKPELDFTEPLAALEAREISAWFGERKVLDRVSLTMEAGRITALIGPSGCGKSTFLRILNRMHELVPSATLAGEVLLDGHDVYDPKRRITEARRDIGMVFQKPNPFPAMSIYDNVVAGLTLTGQHAGRDEKDEIVETALTKAGLWREVRDRLRQPGGGLSGGQQQRLCIARSIAIKPRVLLMDEPCSALDPTSTRVIEETMLELAHEVTIVIVTHNMQQAQRVSSQCAFFLASHGQPGAIVEYGDTQAMFATPIDPRTYDYVNGRFG